MTLTQWRRREESRRKGRWPCGAVGQRSSRLEEPEAHVQNIAMPAWRAQHGRGQREESSSWKAGREQ